MKKKLQYIMPETTVVKVDGSCLLDDVISVAVDPDADPADPSTAESKGNNNQWGFYDYNVESHWGNIWDKEEADK